MPRATLHIEGMSCDHCVRAVSRALTALPGVEVDSVLIGRADVRFDASKVRPEQLTAAVDEAGYQATLNDVRR
jgi:copper chaperone CopZ